jgi:tight adherence protein B
MQDINEIIGRLWVLKYGGFGFVFIGVLIAVFFAARDVEGVPHQLYARYTSHVEFQLHRQFIFRAGSQVALGQAIAIFVLLLGAIFFGLGGIYTIFLLLVSVAGPLLYIERLRRKRVAKIELQLDGFIQALANSLKATPSLGKSFQSAREVVLAPLREEIDLAMKEMRVGSTLDQALLLMAARIGSRQVDTALSALLIGRQVGGNLPKILETTSETLREMGRLDALVQAKTAEGKAQISVLSVFPLLLIISFSAVKSDYFEPLTESITGFAVMGIAALFWLASLVVARKIVSVDI